MPQYPIPQFIEEEGKMISFLTYRQFFLLVGGGAVCFILLAIAPLWLTAVVGIPTILIVVAIAFVKIENETIIKVFLHFLGFTASKKAYIWKKKELSYPIGITEGKQSKIERIKKHIETKK